MANEKRLIDANAIDYENIMCSLNQLHWLNAIIENQPTVDAVEVGTLEAWLYEIALNNSNNSLGEACEEIIRRLNGLRVFARERKEKE